MSSILYVGTYIIYLNYIYYQPQWDFQIFINYFCKYLKKILNKFYKLVERMGKNIKKKKIN